MLKPEKKAVEQAHNHGSKRVHCSGGAGALGHPLIWLTYRQDGTVICPYCSKKFDFQQSE